VRLDVLGVLLQHCLRVKVVRLCLNLADELNRPGPWKRVPWLVPVAGVAGSAECRTAPPSSSNHDGQILRR
jgi:hypothetical protein